MFLIISQSDRIFMYVKCSSLIFCIKLVIVYDTRKKISENCERTDPHPLKKKKDFKAERILAFYEDFCDRLLRR